MSVVMSAAWAVNMWGRLALDGNAQGFAASRCRGWRMGMAVIVSTTRAMDMLFVGMLVNVCLSVAMRMVVVTMAMTSRCIGTTFRLERHLRFDHGQVHGAQHVGQHVVWLDLEMVRFEFDLHMAVAQVIGGTHQIK